MLNSENNRFPNSAELFLLCKEILNIKHARGEKVTDQDVGALLDFDPADCTHWKYGRKNIRNIQSLHLIADKLGLDSRSVTDVAQGRVSLLDTLSDFKSYGSFECAETIRSKLLFEAESLLKKAEIKSLPVYIPELLSIIPTIAVRQQEAQEDLIEENILDGVHVITWPKKIKLCASIRFFLMQRVSNLYLQANAERLQISPEVSQAECNLFSLFLLIPTHLVQLASCQRDPAKDLVDEFSRFFWLTRSLVNIRLKDFFQYKS
ncbi:MAG: hypothetical protein V4591_01080 [Bdellovibrionota bacterium]